MPLASNTEDHVREFFKSFDGLIYRYETGHWFTISCQEVERTPERPIGVKYSAAFFDVYGVCRVRFDNSHSAKIKGRPNPIAFDHWHRFGDNGELVPYEFTTIEQLLTDFFEAIDRHLPPELRSSAPKAPP